MTVAELTDVQEARLAALGWSREGDGFRHASGAWVRPRSTGGWLRCGAPGAGVYVDHSSNLLAGMAEALGIMLSEARDSACYTPLTGREFSAQYRLYDGYFAITERYRSTEDAALAAMERVGQTM